MFAWITGRSHERATAEELYGRVVAAARRPAFYAELGVSDTPEGRYELVALHLFLVLERLRAEGAKGEAIARYALERFVTDMDDCMREMGVGDLTVPKRVKRAAAGFYERAGAYRDALGRGGDDLAQTLGRTVYGDRTDMAAGAEALAHFARQTSQAFARLVPADVLAGRFDFTSVPRRADVPGAGGE